MITVLLGPIVLISAVICSLAQQTSLNFTELTVPLCIRSEFIETPAGLRSDMECAAKCGNKDRCQAFRVQDGVCQLFVFDKCSKYVRDCRCSRTGRVFVKQQPGLPAGALCPAGFTDDFCGTKYKLVSGTSWNAYKAAADAQAGLVIMADVFDEAEWAHLLNVSIKHGWSVEMLGGLQAPGSAEPAGGWYWVDCNIGIGASSSLWMSGEPNNMNDNESYVFANRIKLLDGPESHGAYAGGYLECVSPFD